MTFRILNVSAETVGSAVRTVHLSVRTADPTLLLLLLTRGFFHLTATCRQNAFCVAVRFDSPLENQFDRSLKGDRVLKVGRHVLIAGISGVLTIDDGGHLFECAGDLIFIGDAVMKPVGDVLAGDTQRGTIFHQADVVDIRNLRATDPLPHPADDVTQNALRVVIQFSLNGVSGQRAVTE